ncbi:histidine kinase [Bosea sp. Root381]|uniref:hybrid sensor histidine kinase/response regulator n=1 Tax=Bosea sp. Root381 TaxID=1736524 RepID=UPI0006FBD658|nr:PAS domain-containing sensor histidine kinase [Bosea sp. Root381]KRE18326.1 histidine kinase [Bosea sp. Root381]
MEELDVNERYRLLVEAVTDYAIYMIDTDGRVASWNAGARRFKGYDDQEIIGRPFSDFYTPEDQAVGLPAHALQKARTQGRFESEGWRVRKDGTRFWAHVIIDPVLHPVTGNLLGYAKITRDLTERKQREDALRRSEQSFRLLVQGVTDYAIFMLDEQGIVSNWNAGAERIKGYLPEEIVGRHFSIFYTEEDREGGLPARALDIARSAGSFVTEGWRVAKGGKRFWAAVVIDPIRDDGGTIIGFAKITRDMTASKEAERALAAASEALYQSQKLESLGQLTGGVAHDFNNLLTAVIGSLQLLRKQVTDDRQQRLIDNALEGATRGVTLTQRMLSFARKQEIQPRPVELLEAVSGMRPLLDRSLGPEIQLDIAIPDGLLPAFVDLNQLELAILNLVVNARDAMPAGGTITIRAEERTVPAEGPDGLAAGDYLYLSVIDTGAGMATDTLAKAVEPFFTTKGVGKGTGLGLSMVLGTAEQHGGRLQLESSPGQGTAAHLWLPASEPRAGHPEAAAAAPEATARTLKILAVDDDGLVLMNTVALLEDLGHQVIEAQSGKEALAIFDASVDLVITDHAMPGMTGAELVGELINRRPALPIILATGYAQLPAGLPATVKRLAKPFWQNELDQAIAAAMSRDREPAR